MAAHKTKTILSNDNPIMSQLVGNEEISEYSSRRDQLATALPSKDRTDSVQQDLILAFTKVIAYKEVPFISFGDLNAEELAQAFFNYPKIVKPVLSCVNVAGRAIKRDLGINIDTYGSKLSAEQSSLLAGFVKPILPDQIAIPALLELDRYFWTDKQMRATKGQWETIVRDAIVEKAGADFRKRKFIIGNEKYELDAAYPSTGEPIVVGIDVKRIEAQQDIHKRSDEIINKAAKFKAAYPASLFVAIVYFPFPAQHINLQSRLKSSEIDHVFFAGETDSSIKNCVDMLSGVLLPLIA